MGNHNFAGIKDEHGNYIEGVLETNKGKYFGNFINNELQGQGKCILYNGTILTGEFIDGKLNGPGKINYQCGSFCEGYFINNELTGPGKKYIYNKGQIDKYEGEFKNDYLNGQGTKLVDGNLYEGYFIDNKLDGIGIITYSDGFIYNGRVFNDYPHGYGEKKKVTGTINIKFVGLFTNGDILKGKIYNGDKYKYNGLIKNWKPDGKGKIKYYNDTYIDKYVGNFKNGVIDGYGIVNYKNGDVFDGFMENNNKIYGQLLYSNGDKYNGTFINNNLYNGTIVYHNGIIYSGTFEDNNYYKNGILITPTYLYTGKFVNNKKNGSGKILYVDIEKQTFYEIFIGQFIDDAITNIGYTIKINYLIKDIIGENNEYNNSISYQDDINNKVNGIIQLYNF